MDELTSLSNNRKFHVGLFEVLSHKDLHERKVKVKDGAGRLANTGVDLGGLSFQILVDCRKLNSKH